MHAPGTVVVINGPRFSTRAESRWYRAQGWDVVNMTQYPEAYLARELGMHYAGIALVTDYDTGVEDDPGVEPVTMDQVFAVFDDNVDRVRALLYELLPQLPADPTECSCASALGPLPHDVSDGSGSTSERSLARRSGRATTDEPGIRTGDLVPKRDAG